MSKIDEILGLVEVAFQLGRQEKKVFRFVRNAIKEQKRHRTENNVDALGTCAHLDRLVRESF